MTLSSQTSANYYTDSTGIHLDPPTDPQRKIYLYEETFEQTVEVEASDDSGVIGALTSHHDPSSYGATYEPMDVPDFNLDQSRGDLAIITMSPTVSPFAKNWTKMRVLDAVSIKWRTNFVISQGGFTSLACAIKPSKDFTVMWTGQPLVDSYLTRAGKYMVSALVDVIFTCKGAKPLVFDLEWQLHFGTEWRNGWNFIIDTAITAVSNSWFDFSMTPLMPVRKPREFPHRVRKRDLNAPFPPMTPPKPAHTQFYFVDDYYSDLGSTP